jgi:hypothetical protein
MKVIDIDTGCVLESNNPFVVEQFKKNPNKYQPVVEKTPKTNKK